MKKQTLALALALAGGISANAAQISGSISFSAEPGGVIPINAAYTQTTLISATGLDFGANGSADGSITVDQTSGDFNGLSGTVGAISDFQFKPSLSPNPVSPLWSIDDFSFVLKTVSIDAQTSNALLLSGTGTIEGMGFDDTDGIWTLVLTTAGGTTFSFASDTASVPDAGSSVALLGMALTGLGFAFRRFKA